jgi:hypothetical protein
MPSSFQPMPLSRRAKPFNHPEWLFELEYDGFRALARLERNKGQLDHVERSGVSLYERLYEVDLEGIVAMHSRFSGGACAHAA